jgi:hypothetical protein
MDGTSRAGSALEIVARRVINASDQARDVLYECGFIICAKHCVVGVGAGVYSRSLYAPAWWHRPLEVRGL